MCPRNIFVKKLSNINTSQKQSTPQLNKANLIQNLRCTSS